MPNSGTIFECTGCGTVARDPAGQLDLYRRAGHLSCCPERRMLPLSTGQTKALPRELGPDGKEWAVTEAAYQHVKDVAADRMILPDGAIVWRGRSVREAFIAGAEWQAERSKGND